MKQLLFIGGTHGDEPIGVEALRELESRSRVFDWIIGNPPALQAGKREFEGNLNRSAPGDIRSTKFAARRAAEIIRLAQDYRWTIDLHGTSAATGIFVIVTNPKRKNIELALRLRIPRIVIWPSFSAELSGPLSEYVPCGVEIECGPKDMPKVREKLVASLEDFLRRINTDPEECAEKRVELATFYEVYGSLTKAELVDKLDEFTETTVDDETFFPLLVGQYQGMNGITCYKMRRIENPQDRFSI
ncbi:MAG: succinylglutamate desuccinylase/aspartoacylase family protein [Patescibacteria group bacterium]